MSTTMLMIDGSRFTREFARKQMHRHGFFGDRPWAEIRNVDHLSIVWENAVDSCQHAHGLSRDAFLGPLTARALVAPYCLVPQMRFRGGRDNSNCQFPLGMREKDECEVTYHVDMSGVRGIGQNRAHELVALALVRWAVVCGITYREVDNVNDTDIRIRMKKLGTGTLGMAQLSCGFRPGDQLFCYLQITVIWEEHENGDFAEVVGHEIGHNNGHDHEDQYDSLMTTFAVGKFWKPQCIDIERAQERYKEDTYDLSAPPPDPVDPTPDRDTYTLIGDLYKGSENLGPYEQELRPRDVTPLGD